MTDYGSKVLSSLQIWLLLSGRTRTQFWTPESQSSFLLSLLSVISDVMMLFLKNEIQLGLEHAKNMKNHTHYILPSFLCQSHLFEVRSTAIAGK